MRRTSWIASLLIATLASAAPVKDGTLQGRIQDWEAGKTGEVQLTLGALSPNYLDLLDAVATAKVDAKGNFTLKLPAAAALKTALKPPATSHVLGDPCKGTLSAAPVAALLFFDLTTYEGGLRLAPLRLGSTNLQLVPPGESMALLVYASGPTRLTGTAACGFATLYTRSEGPYNTVWDAQLSAGWNVLSARALPSKDNVLQMSVSGTDLAPGATWTQYLGGSGIGAGTAYSMAGFVPGSANKGLTLVFGSIQAGGPADKAGLKVGDALLSVDAKSVDGLKPEEVARLVRGQPGTSVTITVQRGTETLTFTITRVFYKL